MRRVVAPEAVLAVGIHVYLVEALARLITHLRDYYLVEPHQAVFDLDADPPAHAADFHDIRG